MAFIDVDEIKSIKDLMQIGDGHDYERGELEALRESVETLSRLCLYLGLKMGIDPLKLAEIHNTSHYCFHEFLKKEFPSLEMELIK